MRTILAIIAALIGVTIAVAVPSAAEGLTSYVWAQEFAAPGALLALLVAWPIGTLIWTPKRRRTR